LTAALYMLDTDICIFLMRGDSQTLAARVQSVPLQQQDMSAGGAPLTCTIFVSPEWKLELSLTR